MQSASIHARWLGLGNRTIAPTENLARGSRHRSEAADQSRLALSNQSPVLDVYSVAEQTKISAHIPATDDFAAEVR